MGLKNKVAIVTGAGSGFGEGIARRYAEEGARVVVADIDQEKGEQLAPDIGASACFIAADVTRDADWRRIVDAALDHFGGLHVLVNNAGYTHVNGPMLEVPEDEFDRVYAVNVKSIYHSARHVVPIFRKRGGGSIVNIASLAAVYGMANALHYTTSKAAVIGLSRGLARELGRHWIRVNAVAPSAVKTEGTSEFLGSDGMDRALDIIAGQQALRRNLEPNDVAGTIVYLMSDASKFVTAQTLMVDGGTIAT